MKSFLYTGPQTAVTIGEEDFSLHEGETYLLNEKNAYVRRLVDVGRLKEVASPEVIATADEATNETTTESAPQERSGRKQR